jgi:hypothetical protein
MLDVSLLLLHRMIWRKLVPAVVSTGSYTNYADFGLLKKAHARAHRASLLNERLAKRNARLSELRTFPASTHEACCGRRKE